MACLRQQLARVMTTGGCMLLLLPACALIAQRAPARLRGVPGQPGSSALPSPAATPQPQSAAPQPQSVTPVLQPGTSLLQQPAKEAQIVLTAESLSIHADNSSLTAILREFASRSGMRIEGLSSDERVFGTFGPGAPRDVLADLLNGTAYNVVLLGDLSNGAPRELILTPATRTGGAATPAPAPEVSPDEVSSEQEGPDVVPPPPPEVQQPATTPPPAPGVRTPQQLFEQLQQMRQAQQQQQQQQQQVNSPPEQQ
jgi:hypothetical protein